MQSVHFLLLFALSALSFVLAQDDNPPANTPSGKLVFAHFMIGIVSNRQSADDYDADFKAATAAGIDVLIMNIGVDPYTTTQLDLAYASAEKNGAKAAISFDFNWYSPTSGADQVGQLMAKYGNHPAQLKIDGKAFFSSFAGDGLDVAAVRAAAGIPIFFVPNFHPGKADFGPLDGAFSWQAWDTDGNNKAPKDGQKVTTSQGDESYKSALSGKPYMAPVSPFFFTHYGPEVSYSKNWVFPGDLLWFNRWQELLALKPDFIEIVTWNDYGESHYVGPLKSPHTDDGGSKWVNDYPHSALLDMAKPFIAAYKAGQDTLQVDTEKIFYWYRTQSKDTNCDSTDTTMQTADNSTGNYFMGRPDGFETLQDQVFVVSLLKTPGTIQVNSGGTLYTADVPAGAHAFGVDFKIGSQAFALVRDGQPVDGMSATSLKEIKNECPCGIYNYNFYVGSIPPAEADALEGPGFASFTNGLKVACDPKPSLPATPPETVAPTTTAPVNRGDPTSSATTTSTSSTSTSEASSPPTRRMHNIMRRHVKTLFGI